METFTLRISWDIPKVEVKCYFLFIYFNLPTCHMNISWFSASARMVQCKPLSQICCTCATFGQDLVALLEECKSCVISRKKLIHLQMFVLGKHQHDCITDKYDFRVNSSYLTSLDRRLPALITLNKCHGTFHNAWKARPGNFQERYEWFDAEQQEMVKITGDKTWGASAFLDPRAAVGYCERQIWIGTYLSGAQAGTGKRKWFGVFLEKVPPVMVPSHSLTLSGAALTDRRRRRDLKQTAVWSSPYRFHPVTKICGKKKSRNSRKISVLLKWK